MRTLYVVFVHGSSLFSKSIQVFEEAGEALQGDNGVSFVPTHVGLAEQGKFREAIASGLVGETVDRYSPDDVRVYKLEVTDEDAIASGDQAFNSILGRDYSPRALIWYSLLRRIGSGLPMKMKKIRLLYLNILNS